MLNPDNKELAKTIATRNFLSLAACQCNKHLFIFGSGGQRIFMFKSLAAAASASLYFVSLAAAASASLCF